MQWGPSTDAKVSHLTQLLSQTTEIYPHRPNIYHHLPLLSDEILTSFQLFVHILKIHSVKLDYQALALAMGNGKPRFSPPAIVQQPSSPPAILYDMPSSTRHNEQAFPSRPCTPSILLLSHLSLSLAHTRFYQPLHLIPSQNPFPHPRSQSSNKETLHRLHPQSPHAPHRKT